MNDFQIAGQSHVLTVTRLRALPASCQQEPRPAPRCHPHSRPRGPTIVQFSNRDSLSCGIPLSPWNYLESLLDSQLTRTHPPKKTSFLKSTMPLNITTFQKWHQGHSFQAGGPGPSDFCLLYLIPAYCLHLSSACIFFSGWKLTSCHKESWPANPEDALKLERESTLGTGPTHH